jgi:hypothetical protein
MCPRGEDKSPFFIFLFLQRFPKELRILLGDEALEEPCDIGELADKKWALHSHQHGGTVAAIDVTEEEGQIAAVKQTTDGARARGKRGSRGRGHGGNSQQASEPVKPNQAPAALARMSTGLCHFHWTYGEKAQKCEAQCNWGNLFAEASSTLLSPVHSFTILTELHSGNS